MSEADRIKWDARYRDGAYAARRHATALLIEWLGQLPRGRALDLGCGAGRNALALAAAGFAVDAADISRAALERARSETASGAPPVRWIEADLDTPEGRAAVLERTYDVVLMVRYVNMPLMKAAIDRLADGGYVLCEQHLRTSREVVGPADPAFRVAPNDLLAALAGLRVLYYGEGLVTDPDGRTAALAQAVACRGAPAFERAPRA